MTGWEVQAMKEAEDARIWEELNAPDPYEKQMHEAAREMLHAVEQISKAEDFLVEAAEKVSGEPMEDRILSLLESLEDLECCIKFQQEKYERGDRG